MPGLSYLNQPRRGLLNTVNGKTRAEHDKALRSHIEDMANPDQETSPLKSVTKIRSWKDSHPTADDSELKPDASDPESSGDEGPSRGNIQPSNFSKKEGKPRRQSPTENETEDAARVKKRKISSDRGNSNDPFPNFKPRIAKTYGSNNNAPKAPPAKSSFMRGRAEINKTYSRKPNPASTRKSQGAFDSPHGLSPS